MRCIFCFALVLWGFALTLAWVRNPLHTPSLWQASGKFCIINDKMRISDSCLLLRRPTRNEFFIQYRFQFWDEHPAAAGNHFPHQLLDSFHETTLCGKCSSNGIIHQGKLSSLPTDIALVQKWEQELISGIASAAQFGFEVYTQTEHSSLSEFKWCDIFMDSFLSSWKWLLQFSQPPL